MNSCLYECTVFHRRFQPAPHEFLHRIFLFALDLDELPEVCQRVPLLRHNRSGIYNFRDDDHFQIGPGDARANAEAFLIQNGITEKPARILLLTNTRVLGYVFNPISVWFCQGADGRPLAAIAEVGNTFGELKPFLVPVVDGAFHLRTIKHYYVSPFSDLDLEFDFRFTLPGEKLAVHVDDYKGAERVFTSTLSGERVELTTGKLAVFSLKYPLITLRVIFLIHWHALLLWLKKVPFHRKEANAELQKGVLRPHLSLKKIEKP